MGIGEKSMSLVTTKMDGFVGTLILNRPEKLNSLSEALADDIIAAIEDFEEKRARALVIRAEMGGKGIFSAGHDITELPGRGTDPLDPLDSLRLLIEAVKNATFPTIAMIDGKVFGGANELVSVCDIVIASENAKFCFTPAKIGVPYDIEGLLNMVNAVGQKAVREMIFTAREFDAEWAEKHGLVSRVVPKDKLEEEAYKEAEDVASKAPLAHMANKYTLNALSEAVLPLSSATEGRIERRRKVAYSSADYEEGLKAIKEKRAPVFKDE
jgi:methylmalonyl-CoA decarboxylase